MKKRYYICGVVVFSGLILALMLFLTSCKKNNEKPRLVLLYAPCTVSKHYLSVYNPAVKYTPHLEEFAGDSVVFTNHRTEAGFSGIAYASLFTGTTAERHSIFAHPKKLPDQVYEITEAFRDNGYDTYFWNKHPMASSDLNYAQGANHLFDRKLVAGDKEFSAVLDKLKKDKKHKVFLITNFTVSHSPYQKRNLKVFRQHYSHETNVIKKIGRKKFEYYRKIYTENHRLFSYNFAKAVEKFGLNSEDVKDITEVIELLYKSNIQYLDSLFGEVVKRIKEAGLYEESLIVFTADHGELLSKPGYPFKWSHGFNLSGEVLGVPLIIKSGAGVKKEKIHEVTSSIDVFPTMAGLSGIRLDNETPDGRDLFKIGDRRDERFSAFSFSGKLPKPYLSRIRSDSFQVLSTFFPDNRFIHTWVAVRENGMVVKLKKNSHGRFVNEAYNVKTDPFEINNIMDVKNQKLHSLSLRLLKYKSSLRRAEKIWEKREQKSGGEASNEEGLKKLKSLGYL